MCCDFIGHENQRQTQNEEQDCGRGRFGGSTRTRKVTTRRTTAYYNDPVNL